MAGELVRSEAFLYDLYGYLYRQLSVLWNRSEPRLSLTFPCSTGCRRRWPAADGASNSGRYLPTGEARRGIFCLRDYSGLCSGNWADSRRLAYGYGLLEVDFFHQSACWS